MRKILDGDKLPLFLALILYLLIYFVRLGQGGWEIEIDLFKDQRKMLADKVAEVLPSPQSQLLSGIILGQKQDLPIQFKLALRDTSTLHIVVVSGQNLSMVAGFFLMLSGLVKRKLALILAFLAIILYALLTGAQVPVLRAAIMASASFLAQSFGRQKESVWILLITASFMLLVNPKWILDLSFQLSFLATFGVVSLAPIILKYLKALPIIGQDLAVTTGAQVMVLPIIAHNFHQFSLVGIVTNLLISWTVPIIMILGTIMIVVGIISDILGSILAFFINVLLTYFIYIVQFFASLPFAWEYVGEQSFLIWIGYYLILAAIMLSLNYGQSQNFRGSEKSS